MAITPPALLAVRATTRPAERSGPVVEQRLLPGVELLLELVFQELHLLQRGVAPQPIFSPDELDSRVVSSSVPSCLLPVGVNVTSTC